MLSPNLWIVLYILPIILQEKCAQYWPSKEEQDMDFSDAGFVVTLVSEDVEPNYIIRLLELKNDKVNVMLNHCHWILL